MYKLQSLILSLLRFFVYVGYGFLAELLLIVELNEAD